jgi:hypothetical protein
VDGRYRIKGQKLICQYYSRICEDRRQTETDSLPIHKKAIVNDMFIANEVVRRMVCGLIDSAFRKKSKVNSALDKLEYRSGINYGSQFVSFDQITILFCGLGIKRT